MRSYWSNNHGNSEIRSDASENREAIIRAAHRLFAAGRMDVSLTEIAKAAGVSRPTLYRNFSNKESVIFEVISWNLDLLEEQAKQLENDPDRFFKLMEVIIEQQIEFQALAMQIPSESNALAQRVMSIFETPLKHAQELGKVRSDFQLKRDLILLIMMMGGALQHIDNELDKSAKIKRAWSLAMNGICGNDKLI